MLLQLLTDERVVKNTDSKETEYSFSSGDKEIQAWGFLRYGYNIISIPINEIERMGEWLQNNPDEKMPKDLYGKKITKITYSIEQVKEKARTSKLPLKLINRAYEWIKNRITGKELTRKIQEESERE